jgi:hypothetical protein
MSIKGYMGTCCTTFNGRNDFCSVFMLVNQRVKVGAMTNELAYNEMELIIELINLNSTCP